MVKNIPESQDYIKTGRELLDISWTMIKELLIAHKESGEYFFDDDPEISSEFWDLSSRQLNSAFAITQQAIEFLLKGKICAISPFLLITDPPSSWPSNNKSEIDFSQFRTIDAQDLIKVHDTFSETPLDSKFISMFDDFRRLRNQIMHSISSNIKISHEDIIYSQMAMHKFLFPNESWVKVRIEALEKSPYSVLGASMYINDIINVEIGLIVDLLSPSKVKEFFKIDKKSRAYFCPECYSDFDSHTRDDAPMLARLTGKDVNCSNVYCPICEQEYEVTREVCDTDGSKNCPGNVISEQYGICLTCGG